MTTTDYTVRHAFPCDAPKIARLESICFPEAEAASAETIASRVLAYPDNFTLVEFNGDIVSVVDGPVTLEKDLTDEMYSDTSFHRDDGEWQMIFGVETDPSHRRKGVAELALCSFLEYAKEIGCKGAVLTCKEELVHYYAKFGFINEGVSASSHGGAVWYQMRLIFPT